MTKSKTLKHKEETITLNDGRKIICDKPLTNLIKALNDAGIITLTSCQGGQVSYYRLGTGKTRKYKQVEKAYICIDLRSIWNVRIDHDFLTLEWTLKNPRKNWNESLHLRKKRKQKVKALA